MSAKKTETSEVIETAAAEAAKIKQHQTSDSSASDE